MFGRKSWTSYHPDPTVTTQSTTRTRSRKSSGLMNHLRPRRNTPPTYNTHNAHTTHATHTTHTPVATTTSHRSHGNKTRFGTRKHAHPTRNHHSTNVTAGETVVQARKPSMGDKMSGAMMRLRGSLKGRPGVKGAGTRRMHGTDGRRTRRYY